MSGPIVRKYGFPNFEKIFGARDLQHGVEETDAPASDSSQADNKPSPDVSLGSSETAKPPAPAKKGKKSKK